MKSPGAIMMEAGSHLLPASVPFRFFVGAALFHVVAWALVAIAYDQIASFQSGFGPVLAAIHALTIGVFVSAAMGASFQMLTVATGEELIAVWPCKLASWLLYPGLAVQLYGFYASAYMPMITGAVMVACAITVFIVLTGDIYRRAKTLVLLVRHGWVAMVFLVALSVFGILLIIDMEYGFLSDHSAIAIIHMIVAVFGFMGLLAMGYSQILVPMFALAPSPEQSTAQRILWLASLSILMSVEAALLNSVVLMSVALALGMIAAILHIGIMIKIPATGMRKNLGLSFVLVRLAWGLLITGIILGALVIFDLMGQNGPALFGFVILFGWLLIFLLGIMQRIVPFLASMNATKPGQMPPRPSQLANEKLLKIHAACHFCALAMVMGGIAVDWDVLVLFGAIMGIAGALVFLAFTLDVVRRMATYTPKEI